MMRLTAVQKGVIVAVLVILATFSISFLTDSLVINFFAGYALGTLGMVYWLTWKNKGER